MRVVNFENGVYSHIILERGAFLTAGCRGTRGGAEHSSRKCTHNVSQLVSANRQSLSQTDLRATSERLDASRESRQPGNRSLGNANRVPMATAQGRKNSRGEVRG
ncbi:hypothetical protein SRHO_G00013840 [Serrasalmus rhombeus]